MTTEAPPIATEFCGTSITSRGRAQSATDEVVRENPHIILGDSARRGYFLFDVTPQRCTARLRVIGDATDRHTTALHRRDLRSRRRPARRARL